MKISLAMIVALVCFVLAFTTTAQDSSPEITAQNIHQLHSVFQFNFDDWLQQVGKIENGWFALKHDGSRFAVMNRTGEVVIGDDAGQLIDHYSVPGSDNLPSSVLDIAFRVNDPAVVSAHVEGGTYYVAYRYYETHHTEYFRFDTLDVPLRIWETGLAWLEVSPADYSRSRYVQALRPSEFNGFRANEMLPSTSIAEFESGPESDPDAFLRIGRIDPPYAITVSQNFVIKLWNLEADVVLASAQLDELPGAGQLTPDGRYFAWRDGDSKNLHLLDFKTGNDRIVAPLNGDYTPFLLVNSSATIIIGVNVALEPIVVSWNITTGERVNFGEYRACSRQPDMVRLSYDDTSLVIGCDQGLDIWRISPK